MKYGTHLHEQRKTHFKANTWDTYVLRTCKSLARRRHHHEILKTKRWWNIWHKQTCTNVIPIINECMHALPSTTTTNIMHSFKAIQFEQCCAINLNRLILQVKAYQVLLIFIGKMLLISAHLRIAGCDAQISYRFFNFLQPFLPFFGMINVL